jgi:hypothetical protein
MDFKPAEAARLTIHDSQQTISLFTDRDMATRFLAACSANPNTLEELLLATEVYQRGIATWLMGQLMEFDKAWRQQGSAYLQRAFDTATEGESRPLIFEVVDELTKRTAFDPSEGALMVLDLPERRIRLTADLQIPREGHVLVRDGRQLTDRTITYILPQSWDFEALS